MSFTLRSFLSPTCLFFLAPLRRFFSSSLRLFYFSSTLLFFASSLLLLVFYSSLLLLSDIPLLLFFSGPKSTLHSNHLWAKSTTSTIITSLLHYLLFYFSSLLLAFSSSCLRFYFSCLLFFGPYRLLHSSSSLLLFLSCSILRFFSNFVFSSVPFCSVSLREVSSKVDKQFDVNALCKRHSFICFASLHLLCFSSSYSSPLLYPSLPLLLSLSCRLPLTLTLISS